MNARSRHLAGKYLNGLWGIGAKHALYREDGKWYHRLLGFPGVLFDADGFVVFRTEVEYKESPFLQIRQDLHVPKGISAMPNYVRVSEKGHLQSFSQAIKETAGEHKKYRTNRSRKRDLFGLETSIAADMPAGHQETNRALSESYRIIRDTKVSKWVKFVHNYRCQICGETIALGNGMFYSEAHHLQPLGKRHNGPDIVENVICVCPNHHALLDYGAIILDKSQLLTVPGHEISDAYIAYHNTEIYEQP